MMANNNIRLQVFLATMLLFSFVKVNAQSETVLGYCNDKVDEYSFGFSWDNSPFSTGIYLSEEKLEPYADGEIVTVRIGLYQGEWEESLSDVKLWIKDDIKSDENIYEQEVGDCNPGWNDIVLTHPFKISGQGFYIGYDAVQKTAGCAPVSYTRYETPEIGSLYINGSDQSEMYNGSLSLQCIVNSSYSPEPELTLDSLVLEERYFMQGEDIVYTLMISNSGRIVRDFQIQYQLDDMEPVFENKKDSVGNTGVCKGKIVNNGLDMGMHTLYMKISQVEGRDVNTDYVTGTFIVYDKGYERNILLEHVTSADCRVCPLGTDRLKEALQGRKNINWVSYHMNMSPSVPDPYSISFSSLFYNAMFMYGVPMFTVDRTDILGDNTSSYACAGSIGSTLELLDAAEMIPAFVSINFKSEFDKDNNCIDVYADGERAEYYSLVADETRISFLVVEDSLVNYQNNDGEYIEDYVHNNVVRMIYPEDGFGEQLSWDGDSFSFIDQIPYNPEWKLENLRCVAFVHRPLYGQFDSQVMNSAVSPIRIKGALRDIVCDDDVNVYVSNRRVMAGAEDCVVEVFDLSGKFIPNKDLSDGLYVAKVTCGNSISVHKVIVR